MPASVWSNYMPAYGVTLGLSVVYGIPKKPDRVRPVLKNIAADKNSLLKRYDRLSSEVKLSNKTE